MTNPPKNFNDGAGEGNRTLVLSLEGFSSTIELHLRYPGISTGGNQIFPKCPKSFDLTCTQV